MRHDIDWHKVHAKVGQKIPVYPFKGKQKQSIFGKISSMISPNLTETKIKQQEKKIEKLEEETGIAKRTGSKKKN